MEPRRLTIGRALERIGGVTMRSQVLGALTAALLLFACNGSGPTAFSNVAVSFATRGASAGSVSESGFFSSRVSLLSDTLVDTQGNTLIVASAEIVLREIELKAVEVPNCDVDPEPEGCEEFEAGPVLVSLPLEPGAQALVAIEIPSGTYSEMEFEVHKVTSGDPADQVFLQGNPAFVDKSMRVIGTFNGSVFEYTSDLNVEQKLDLQPNLVIGTGQTGATNVTILIDVDDWFRDSVGNLVDPTTANQGQPNQSLVNENIKTSMEAYEDRDRDGKR